MKILTLRFLPGHSRREGLVAGCPAARMYLHQTELQFGLGQPRQSWDELEQLIDDPAVALPSWLVAFTHGFFAAWDDEAAEER